MNPEGALAPTTTGHVPETPAPRRGFHPAVWIFVALLALGAQAVFYQRLAFNADPAHVGQFGLANAALGAVGLLAVPILALHLAFRLFAAQKSVPDVRLRTLRQAHVLVLENASWAWGGVCVALVILPLPVPSLPSFSLQLFELMNVFLLLGGIVAFALCEEQQRWKRWAVLVLAAFATRLAVGAGLTTIERQAEAVLAACVVAGFITLTPALGTRPLDPMVRLRAFSVFLEGDFRNFALATLSTAVGIYLFTSADRIASLQWFNIYLARTTVPNVQLRQDLDAYQFAGLLIRAVLWGAQPLLWLLYRKRVVLTKSTSTCVRDFALYLVVVLVGVFAVGYATQPERSLATVTNGYGPTLAGVAMLLGVLQGLGIFCLASRRYIECHVLAACSIFYGLVLAWFGHRPDILLPDMFGVALISLMVLLLVGVVRWGRRQP